MAKRSQLFLAPFTLFGFALAQPLFDLLGRQPMFLLEHEVGPRELTVLALITWIGPGLAAGLIGVGLHHWRARSGRAWLAFCTLILAAATLLPLAAQLAGQRTVPSLALAVFAGLGCALAVLRSTLFPRALAWGALAPVLFTAVFALRPATRSVIFAGEPQIAAVRQPEGALRPLVLVVMDELPTSSLLRGSNEIDAARYPNFAALQKDSVWFRNAYTVSGATHRSLVAIFTANYVRDDTAPTLANYPQNLFTLLQGTHAPFLGETATRLAPTVMATTLPMLPRQRIALLGWDCGVLWLHRVAPAPWRQKLPPVDDRWIGFGRKIPHRPGHPGRFLDWADNIQRSDKPILAVTHTQFPHNPYNYYPNGTKHSHRDAEPHKAGGPWVDDLWPVEQSWQRSLLQLQYADALLGHLFDRLRQEGLYDEAVIAITADHGASYHAADFHRRLTETNYWDVLPVPMFLKLPDSERAGTVDERLFATIDLLPTLAAACGFELPWDHDGQSMLDPATPGRTEALFYDPAGNDILVRYSLSELQQAENTRLRKLELFGEKTGEWADYAVGPHADLVGRPLAEFEHAGASQLTAFLRNAEQLERVHRRAEMVPGELRGELESPFDPSQRHALAVGLRDSIVAVTQSVVESASSASQDWMALVPFTRLREGKNRIALFEIDERWPMTLRSIALSNDMPSFLGRQLVTTLHERVRTTGFYPEFRNEGQVRRWTDGEARLTVPIRPGEEAAILRIDIQRSTPQGSELHIRCGDVVVFADRIAPGLWRRDLPLPAQAQSALTTIELRSTPFVPAQVDSMSTDERQLGILLNGLWLLAASEPGRRDLELPLR